MTELTRETILRALHAKGEEEIVISPQSWEYLTGKKLPQLSNKLSFEEWKEVMEGCRDCESAYPFKCTAHDVGGR